MDKYIVDLLKSSNRIIIPELGAFITKKDDPQTIVFNEFLKFNDGVFVDHVAEKEGIDSEKALEKTESFVKMIFEEMEKGGAHVIEGLGEFRKDDKGKIQFVPDAAIKDTPKSKKGLKKVAPIVKPAEKADSAKEKEAMEAKRKEEEAKKEAEEKKREEEIKKEKEKKEAEEKKRGEEMKKEKEEKEAEEKKKEEESKKEELKKEEAKKKEEGKKKEEIKAQPVVDPTPKKSEEPKELIELDEKNGEKPIPEKAVIKAKDEKPAGKKIEKETTLIHTEKKKFNLLWLLLILIPVILFVVWFVFLKDGKQSVDTQEAAQPEIEKSEEAATPQPAVTVTDSTETEESQPVEEAEIIPEEPEVVEEEVVSQPVASGGKMYYIVAGCFEKEGNADKYVTLLRNKGFNPEKFRKIGRLHAVSFNSFPSREEAITELMRIRETTEPSAWLLYY